MLDFKSHECSCCTFQRQQTVKNNFPLRPNVTSREALMAAVVPFIWAASVREVSFVRNVCFEASGLRPICDSYNPKALFPPKGGKNAPKPILGWTEWELPPSRSPSCHHRVSIILIKVSFANNNCKYNLTNNFTHNTLYIKS